MSFGFRSWLDTTSIWLSILIYTSGCTCLGCKSLAHRTGDMYLRVDQQASGQGHPKKPSRAINKYLDPYTRWKPRWVSLSSPTNRPTDRDTQIIAWSDWGGIDVFLGIENNWINHITDHWNEDARTRKYENSMLHRLGFRAVKVQVIWNQSWKWWLA